MNNFTKYTITTLFIFLNLNLFTSLKAQVVVIDSFPLASVNNAAYIWGETTCSSASGAQVFNYTLPACYNNITIEMGMASDGNLDWSSGSSYSDHVDINITVDGTPNHVVNHNPDFCGSGNFNSAVTLSGESSCNCDWGQLSPNCPQPYQHCPGNVAPGVQVVSQSYATASVMAITFNYVVSNSAGGACENVCDERIQVDYIVIKGEACPIKLPVELINFDVRKIQGKASLYWNAYESNFHRYEVESSIDANNWDLAEVIMGKGLASINAYQTTLPIPNCEKVYYRLKMIDIDGTAEYSNVRSISGNKYTGYFSVGPNPVKNSVHIKSNIPDSGSYKIDVYNRESKRVLQANLSGEFQTLDLSELRDGIYFVRIYNEKGFNDTIKIIKTD